MSTVGTITRLAGTVVTRTAQVVTHPLQTTRYAAGLARDVAGAVLPSGPGDQDRDRPAGDTTAGAARPEHPAPEVITPDPEAAAGRPPIPVDDAPAPVATEPTAPSRDAAHGGPGDETADDWREEIDDGPEVETAVGTTGAAPGTNPDTGETDGQQPGTEPLMEPSLTKAVRAEAETLRRASEPTKE